MDLIEKDDDFEAEIHNSSKFVEDIYEILVRLDEAIEDCENQKKKEEQPELKIASDSGATSAIHHGAKTKLPKLIIRKFNGEPSNWSEFWDIHESSVHKNPTLTDLDRFNYLKTLVEGPAYSTIYGLTLTSENYGAAIEMLKERFGQNQLIISSHIDKQWKIQPVTVSSDVRKLRKLYDGIETHCRWLKEIGVHEAAYGELLVPVI